MSIMPKNLEKASAFSEGMQTRAKVKNRTLIIDEPQQVGGKDERPNLLGTLLSALAGSENVIANLVAKEITGKTNLRCPVYTTLKAAGVEMAQFNIST
jgi:uncharacterized OsmC-like protein